MIDPIKLFQKYKWALVIAAFLGGAGGIAAHFVWMKVYPFWRPKATFEVFPPQRNPMDVVAGTSSNEEMNRFIMTQARIMLSGTVLTKVAEDPSLREKAPLWSARFSAPDPTTGITRFDSTTAAKELEEYLQARPVGGANLIQLQCTYKDKREATEIVRLAREKYMALLEDRARNRREESTQSFETTIDSTTRKIESLQQERDRIIRERGLDTSEDNTSVAQRKLDDINKSLTEYNNMISSMTERLRNLERQRNTPVPVFGDELEADADKDPVVLDIRSRIESLESGVNSMRERGIGPDHPQMKLLESEIRGAKQNLDITRKEVLRKLFNAQFESIKNQLEASAATIDSLKTEQASLNTQIVDLQQAKGRVRDLTREIEELGKQRSALTGSLAEVLQMLSIETASRVELLERESLPPSPDFPKLQVLAPLGALLLTGLLGTFVVLRELIDQRVRGPNDIMLIPRTRVLGWIPDSGEDPAGQGNAETAFRDRSKGVVAESYRQLRGQIGKRLAMVDHKTILVLGGMPGSGASSAVSNMALAYATSDRRVLILDANLRRPSQHKIMGLQEAPGLADVLAQRRTLAEVVQATSTPNLDLLSAGSKELRQYERLSTQAMTDLLAQVKGMYDVVLIDCSPAIVGGDGLAIAQRCDASVLIVRAMAEKRGMVARIKNELADARAEFLGVVVNGVKASAGGYMRGNIKAASEYIEG
ncbi:MAG: polysaccharide biosynthesis tyrosine autokinase [Phycisphaerales bacterium]